MEHDALLIRVRKLLNLAHDKGATEAEAALAMERVQSILAEHNLTMAQVDAVREKTKGPSSDPLEKREKTKHTASAMYKYQQDLMQALARNNFCMWFLDDEVAHSFGKQRRVKRHVLLGREVNVITTQIMYDYLVETMDRMLPYTGMEKRGKDALLWLAGCGDRLVERLNAKRYEEEEAQKRAKAEDTVRRQHPSAAASTNGALIILSEVYGSETDLNNDVLYNLEPGTTAKRRAQYALEAQEREDRRKARVAAMIEADPTLTRELAEYIDSGWDRARAEYACGIINEEEARKRGVKFARASRSRSSGHYRESASSRRARERQDDPVYRAGARSAESIGLDRQVKDSPSNKIK